VSVDDRQLLVAGRREDDGRGDPASYLHRGIAARGFQRAFVLADGMDVKGATLEHGLLHIDVVRDEAVHEVIHIHIRTAG
jgi:HSP20 family molecular chaperone IbpA